MQPAENGNGFSAVLSKLNLVDKCAELSKLIEKSNIKILHQNYATLVHQIFAVTTPAWNLHHINSRTRYAEFNSIKVFLGVHGPMLQMVHKLQSDSTGLFYEFPITFLPPSIDCGTETLMHRGLPKVPLGPWQFTVGSTMFKGQTCLRLSAFEFFFYHFARYIINPPVQPPVQQPFMSNLQPAATPEENVYAILLDAYLFYFLPLDGPCPPTMHSSSSPKESSMQVASPWFSPVTGMLKKSPGKAAGSLGVTQNEIWRSDMLVHILVEFWLGQSATKERGKVPSEELVRCVRCLVKHIHHFSNASSFPLHYSGLNDSVMEQFKLKIASNCLQPKLFDFLVYCFEAWPLNATFRTVLETWLSYIQPWRYTDISAPVNNAEMRLSASRDIANAWFGFISRNLSFYTRLLVDALSRFLRMDLSNHMNSLLLYRVAKIFSQPNLMEMVEEAEDNFEKSFHQVPGSYIASPGLLTSRTQVLFSQELPSVVKQLLVVCKQALATLQKNKEQHSSDFSGRVLKLIGLESLSEVGHLSGADASAKRCMQQLQDAMKMLSELFELPIPELDDSMSSSIGDKTNPLGPDAADCVVDEQGHVQLTELGKYQMINNIRKLPIFPKCDPELQPIRSYENATLVRYLYKVSTSLTKTHSKRIDKLCERRDFLGKYSRFYLLPYSNSKSPVARRHDQPRVSLRFLANYRTMFYIVLFFSFFGLLGYSKLTTLFYLLVLMFSYSVVRVLVHE